MRDFLYKWRYELFALAGMVLVMWQLLLPGYVLTLDLVFGPSHVFYPPTGFLDSLPVAYLIYAISLIIPAWIVEKAILIAIFFLLFYLPLRFFPEEFESSEWVKYFAAIFYAINPFVYERFLAGQWEVLVGYALLAPLLYSLLRFLRMPRMRAGMWIALWLLVIGLFSVHTLVMSVLFVGLAIVLEAGRLAWRGRPDSLALLARSSAAMAVVFVVVSGYWLVPALFAHTSPLASFGTADAQAFMTASDPIVGATGNTALLMGFWGEAYPWAEQFILPKAVSTFIPGAIALFALILIGACTSIRMAHRRRTTVLICIFGVLAFIFSMGNAGAAHALNGWLFAHVSFWRGFRDSEKWSMWLALAYAYLAATGFAWTIGKVHKFWPSLRTYAICVMLFIPLLYSAPMIGGFYGQLSPLWYPASWYQVNDAIKGAPDCSAVFLPWHLYYSLSFDHDIITADPAPAFFDCQVVSGQDADIGSIVIGGGEGGRYGAIQAAVTDNAPQDVVQSVDILKASKIRYIISTGDLLGVDPYAYRFLTDATIISRVIDLGAGRANISLYTIPN